MIDSLQFHEKMLKTCKTLAFAESCTGGLLAHTITRHEGASKYFLGSFVSYSEGFKKQILSVNSHTLSRYSAVSLETTYEMCLGVFSKIGADYALAVTGFAGTQTSLEGIVFAVFGSAHHLEERTYRLQGNRESVLNQSCKILITDLHQYIAE